MKKLSDWLKKRSVLIVIVLAAVLLQVISAIQYQYTRGLLEEELEKSALQDLMTSALRIQEVVARAEMGVTSQVWHTQRHLDDPDYMNTLVANMARDGGANIVGAGIAFKPYFYPSKGRLFEVYGRQTGAPLAVASISLTLLLLSANTIVLDTLGRAGIFAFAVCMNLLQVYNLFLSGTCQTLQSLGAIQVGRGDAEGVKTVIRKAFRFITVAMATVCVIVWIDPQLIVRLFGANEPDLITEAEHALRIFALSFIPFCYIYVLMIVYKLYSHHHMALFISFALSLTVIPVLWLMAGFAPNLLWYSYLIAYLIEAIAIVLLHRVTHASIKW